MSRIEEMIEEMCPDGVEYRRLGDCCKIETGRLNANAAVEDGEYPFFTTAQEVSHIDSYRWDTEALMIAGNANVGDVKYYKGKFEAYQRTYVLTNFAQGLLPKFLFYVMKNNLKSYLEDHKHEAAMTYIVLSSLQGFEIPVPPLQVQEEIVRTLDAFTKLAAELATELAAELAMRTKQYAYYRDELLKLEGVEGVEYRRLGDVTVFYDGYPFKKKQFGDEGIPIIRTTNLQDGMIDISTAMKCATYDASLEKYRIQYGDVLIGMSGTIKIARNLTHKKMLLNQRVGMLRESDVLNNNYLYHYLCAHINDLYDMCSGGTVVNLSKKALLNFIIPVPPLPVQQDIVTKLDAFSSYCTDLTAGLPAEIAAREKQYAYYRDIMLSFPVQKNK